MVTTESYFDNLSLVQPYCVKQLSIFYTVGHKKLDTFIFVITLANVDRFS